MGQVLEKGHRSVGALSIRPKISEILVIEFKWNETFWFGPTRIFGTTFDSTKNDINMNILHRYPDCKYGSLQK